MNPRRLYIYQLICKFLPLTSCYGFKASMLRWCGAKVGKGVEIFSTAKIYGQMELSIGDFCFIGHDALIFGSANSKIIIEDYAKVGSKSILVTGSHEYTPDGNCIAGKGVHADVRICKGASVGTRAIILPGKTVNTMAHVAAGSVVTHDVPEYCRVAGVPARVIKNWKNESANQFC